MGHSHSHGHGPDADEAITPARTQKILQLIVIAVAVAAAMGLVLLRPTGDLTPPDPALGFDAERLDATVTNIDIAPCQGTTDADGVLCQKVEIKVTSGSTKGDTASFEFLLEETAPDIDVGSGLIVGHDAANPQAQYYFIDLQRRTPLIALAVIFVLAVLALGRLQGLRALLALALTGVVLVAFMLPALLEGRSPLAVALVGSALIALAALYLTHGINERTTVALLGTFASLAVIGVLAAVFVAATKLSGLGSENAVILQLAGGGVSVRGLVLAGIVIGSLGVLDDVTVTQVSAVWELHVANPDYGVRHLYDAATRIGRDHIASTVNTLVLAYAGASLPLLLLYRQAQLPISGVLNGEEIAIEVVRTLVGSIGLVASVPITTALAAVVVSRAGGDEVRPTAVESRPDDPASVATWDDFAPE